MNKPRRRFRSHSRRAAIAVLAALLIAVVLGIIAFAIDLGYIAMTRTQLQAAADSAAMAAVVELPDAIRVGGVARLYASVNAHGDDSVLSNADVEAGNWDEGTATFTPTLFPDEADAVRVTLRRTQGNGNAVPLFFARVIGTGTADVLASATARIRRGLCGALIGIESVNCIGNPSTDSYHSSQGRYNPSTAGNNGSLCSDGPISVVGSAYVDGNANPGEGHTTQIVGAARVTGSTTPRTSSLNLPPVDASGAAVNNDNHLIRGDDDSPLDDDNNFSLGSNDDFELPAGVYYFNSFNIDGQASLTVSGPTVIYVTGSLDTAGARSINYRGDPSNLQILMTGSTARIIGNADFYGILYAPNTAVTITGNGSMYGAVVGRTLTVQGNGSAHYDEDLRLSDRIQIKPRAALVE